MKLREFWVNPMQVDKPLFTSYNLGDVPPQVGSIHVREVSPRLDAAWDECEKALIAYRREYENPAPDAIQKSNMRKWLFERLAALRKARE